MRLNFYGKKSIGEQSSVGNHHSFGESGGTGGIVDHCQLVWRLFIIVLNIIGRKTPRILLPEKLIKVLSCMDYLTLIRIKQRKIGNLNHSLEIWHFTL